MGIIELPLSAIDGTKHRVFTKVAGKKCHHSLTRYKPQCIPKKISVQQIIPYYTFFYRKYYIFGNESTCPLLKNTAWNSIVPKLAQGSCAEGLPLVGRSTEKWWCPVSLGN